MISRLGCLSCRRWPHPRLSPARAPPRRPRSRPRASRRPGARPRQRSRRARPRAGTPARQSPAAAIRRRPPARRNTASQTAPPQPPAVSYSFPLPKRVHRAHPLVHVDAVDAAKHLGRERLANRRARPPCAPCPEAGRACRSGRRGSGRAPRTRPRAARSAASRRSGRRSAVDRPGRGGWPARPGSARRGFGQTPAQERPAVARRRRARECSCRAAAKAPVTRSASSTYRALSGSPPLTCRGRRSAPCARSPRRGRRSWRGCAAKARRCGGRTARGAGCACPRR